MHARQQILNAVIQALIAGVPAVQRRVAEDVALEIPEGELPAIVVRVTDEQIVQQLQVKERRLRVEIVAGAQGKQLQGELNALTAAVEVALDGGLTFAPSHIPLQHQAVTAEVAPSAAKKTGAVMLAYEATYYTPSGDPSQIL